MYLDCTQRWMYARGWAETSELLRGYICSIRMYMYFKITCVGSINCNIL